jgi:hypothetical protein
VEAFAFVRILYDVSGCALPDAVLEMDKSDGMRCEYIKELLTDVENIL